MKHNALAKMARETSLVMQGQLDGHGAACGKFQPQGFLEPSLHRPYRDDRRDRHTHIETINFGQEHQVERELRRHHQILSLNIDHEAITGSPDPGEPVSHRAPGAPVLMEDRIPRHTRDDRLAIAPAIPDRRGDPACDPQERQQRDHRHSASLTLIMALDGCVTLGNVA